MEHPMRIKKTEQAPENLPGSIRQLWGHKKLPSRGPKPLLAANQIVQTAVRIADNETLSALSLQRIAKELNVTSMALYRYFPSKTAIVALMVDTVAKPAPALKGTRGTWQLRLKEWARRCLRIYLKHPWLLEATSTGRRVMGPNELAWFDSALAALADAGLRSTELRPALLGLLGQVRSSAEFMSAGSEGLSASEWSAIMTRVLEPHHEHYPALAKALDSGEFTKPSPDGFEFGIECILRGIESFVQDRLTRK
jgi:AcrR family transcriptional regulator